MNVKIALGALLSLLWLWMGLTHAQSLPEAPEASQSPKKSISRLELTLASSSIAADMVSTRLIITTRGTELNPMTRPFVRSNAGAAGLWLLGSAGMTEANLVLRNHPRWRHVLNWTVIAGESALAVNNAHRYLNRPQWAR